MVDSYALFFKALFTVLGIILVFLVAYYLKIKKLQAGKFYLVLLLAILAAMAVVSSASLITMFVLFVVLISISYMLMAGFAFKMTVVPFHSHLVDVYQGTLTPIIAAVSKVAALAILIRLLFSGLNADLLSGKQAYFLWALGAFSLIGGSITLLVQTNIRRLFAAASIIQVGYMLIGLGIATKSGADANEYLAKVMFYLVAYSFAIIGIFAALSACRRDGTHLENTEDLRGLIRRSPALAIGITLLCASFAGIPGTAGFMGKLYVLRMVSGGGFSWQTVFTPRMVYWLGLLIIIHIEAIIYTRLLKKVLLGRPSESAESLTSPRAVIFACVIILLVAGVLPNTLLGWAKLAVGSLF